VVDASVLSGPSINPAQVLHDRLQLPVEWMSPYAGVEGFTAVGHTTERVFDASSHFSPGAVQTVRVQTVTTADMHGHWTYVLVMTNASVPLQPSMPIMVESQLRSDQVGLSVVMPSSNGGCAVTACTVRWLDV
jgi:hypothetical protein